VQSGSGRPTDRRCHEPRRADILVVMDDRDADAFRALYRRHYRSVCRFLATRTAADQVEDLASETFLVAWRWAGSVPDMQLPWLLNVATKCLANHRRGGERREALTERLTRVARVDAPGVEVDAERRRQQRAVIAALATLHAHDRELLLLYLWDDLRPREIAVVLELSPLVVRARLSRARRRLQRALDAELGEPSIPQRPMSLTAEGSNS
jgi:RNA polymerase sigma factor (sigma-70 family)